MKTSNVLIRLFILALLFTPFLTTTEASAQTCSGATPCGTWPNCYAAPLVDCPDQFEHIITSYCSPGSGSLCDPGLFVCMSTTLPTGWTSCSTDCSGANNCIYINIRNLLDCDGNTTYPQIKKIELQLNKHSGSTSSYVCDAKSQWTTSWTVTGGACSSWGGGTTREVTTEAASSSDYVPLLGHYQAVVCGASSVDIKVTYQTSSTQTTTTAWLTGITVNTSACPEYGDDHGWCQ